MPVKNVTKGTLLSKRAKICKSIFSKSVGLMFSKSSSLVFVFDEEKIIPLHMFFVFYPIDVLFLDKNRIVVEVKENLRPFTVYTPKKIAMYVIEVPVNTVRKTKTEIGDRIEFQSIVGNTK